MKIPFTLDAWLKDKSQKVETRDGRLVHNIWRVKKPTYTNNRKAEVCALIDGEEDALVFFEGGRYLPTTKDTDSPFDLFIITPEPELSEFEKAVGLEIFDEPFEERHIKVIKEESAKLLVLASDQFIKDGYVIEKKVFKDAVGKVAPEVMKEVSDKVDMEEALRLGYEKGRADALKDLPTWRTIEETTTKRTDENDCVTTETMLVKGCMNRNDYRIIGPECMVNRKMLCIPVVELSKLPGFKEDEK